jgi:hypothetical protein
MNRAICLALALAAIFAVPEASAEPVRWQYELLELCGMQREMLNNENHYRGYYWEMPNRYRATLVATLEKAMLNNENRDRATQEMLDMAISIRHKCFLFQIAPVD